MTPASARGGSGAVFAYLVIVFLWGSTFIFTKWLDDLITPLQVSLIRIACGLVPIAIFGLVTRSFRVQHLRYLPHFFVMSLLANSVYFWAIAAGTYRLDTSIAGSLTGSIPIFTFLLSVFILRSESITAGKAAGVGIGAVGVVLLARPWDAGSIDPQGVGFMLLAAFMYGLSFAYARRFITPLGIPAAAGATYQMALATLSLLLVTPLHGFERLLDDPQALWGLVLGLGVLGTGLSTVLYYVLVRSYGAVTAATSTYFPPVVAVVIGIVVLHEPFRPLALVALGMLLTAAFLTRARPKRPNTPPPATT